MYGRLGWKESERVTYRGREVLVMERPLPRYVPHASNARLNKVLQDSRRLRSAIDGHPP